MEVPPGANPDLARAVRRINLKQYVAQGATTYCNQAFDAYARQHGYRKFSQLVANQMFKFMDKPGNGWKRATAEEAVAAAAQGKLVAAAWYNHTPRKGRPDGRAPGHIAAVVGEFAPGVPGVAQAGRVTFEWGSVADVDRPNPTYFVLQAPPRDQPAVSRAPRRREP
jgi:hypothetical protein